MIDYIVKGGLYVMIPLVFLSIVSLAFILERIWRYSRVPSGEKADKILKEASDALTSGEIERAIQYCKRHKNILTFVYLKILARFEFLAKEKRTINEMRSELALTAEENSRNYLEEYLSIIYTVYTVAPMLGLTGTITGMIKSYGAIAAAGVGDPSVVAAGISEALITTAAGLFIAVPSLLAFNFFRRIVENRLPQLEPYSALFINAVLRDLARFRTYKEMLLTAYRDGILNRDEELFLKEKRIELNIADEEGAKLEREVKELLGVS